MDRTVSEQAQRALVEAQQAQARGDRERAIALLDQGIALLGDEYLKGHPPWMKDDTGMKVLISESEQADGRLDVVIALRSGVLEDRLKLYAEGHCPPVR